jgi:predicted transcriptional regulator
MLQLEAKIETARHNLKITMDKELVVLQKQINLHVSDIERYQGFVSRLSVKKGETVEELRRNKEKARKTMKQLKAQRVVTKNQGTMGGGGQSTLAAAGRESIAQSNFKSQTAANQSTEAFIDGSAVDVLLFGFKKNDGVFATSFNASQSSENLSGNAHVVKALRHIIKMQPIINFQISTVGADGRRLYSEENVKAAGGIGKMSQEAQLQTKI